MSDRLNSAARRLKLIILLQSKRYVTVNEIAEEFDISRRTVFRDMNMLADMGVPVLSDKDRGYSISKYGNIPPLMFTERELATLIVGLGFLRGQVDDGLSQNARDLELKIQSVIPDNLKQFMRSMSEKVILYPYEKDQDEAPKNEAWYAIMEAIHENKSLSFNYKSHTDKEIAKRTVDPYLLVYYTDHWDLIGFCYLSNSLRTFVLARISDLEIDHSSFVSRRGLSTTELLYRGDGYMSITVRVEASIANAFLRALPAQVVSIKSETACVEIVFSFNNTRWINQWLLQFGEAVTIVSPDHVVADRKELLKSLIDVTK
jgi:predicted DNA-binding transcriptional regulator YafY